MFRLEILGPKLPESFLKYSLEVWIKEHDDLEVGLSSLAAELESLMFVVGCFTSGGGCLGLLYGS